MHRLWYMLCIIRIPCTPPRRLSPRTVVDGDCSYTDTFKVRKPQMRTKGHKLALSKQVQLPVVMVHKLLLTQQPLLSTLFLPLSSVAKLIAAAIFLVTLFVLINLAAVFGRPAL